MLPTSKQFASELRALGINKSDVIVIYDYSGLFTASTRLWWQFQVFGCVSENIFVLDGGLDAWKSNKYPAESGVHDTRAGNWDIEEYNSEWVMSMDDIIKLVQNRSDHSSTSLETKSKSYLQILDARPLSRYNGVDPEPRVVLRRGHIPGAIAIPWQDVTTFSLVQEGGRKTHQFKSLSDIGQVFKDSKVDTAKPVLTYCGSGVTAATLSFSLCMLGATQLAVYDGSWAEWGNVEKVAQLIEPQTKATTSVAST